MAERIHDLVGHALSDCSDPDCEIHRPWVIEDDRERDAAMAWALVGARGAIGLVAEGLRVGYTPEQAVSAAYGESKDDPQFPDLVENMRDEAMQPENP